MILFQWPRGSEWLLIIFGILLISLFIYLLRAIYLRKDFDTNQKALWILFLLAAPGIGLICYALFGRAKPHSMQQDV